jgi:hypothetical protein
MKQTLVIAIIALSCSCKMHIGLTKSYPDISRDSVYVFENDTVRITYDFWFQKGQMKFSIYNKLNVPLFIDWKNSALIINDHTIPYYKDLTTHDISTAGSAVSVGGYTSHSSRSSGESIHLDRISFIPAHAKIDKKSNIHFVQHWRPDNSDLHRHIRNYIAYSTLENFNGENFADNDFEVVDFIKVSSVSYRRHMDRRYFYTDK